MILCGALGRPRRIIYKLNIIKKILFGFCIWSSAGGVDEYKKYLESVRRWGCWTKGWRRGVDCWPNTVTLPFPVSNAPWYHRHHGPSCALTYFFLYFGRLGLCTCLIGKDFCVFNQPKLFWFRACFHVISTFGLSPDSMAKRNVISRHRNPLKPQIFISLAFSFITGNWVKEFWFIRVAA